MVLALRNRITAGIILAMLGFAISGFSQDQCKLTKKDLKAIRSEFSISDESGLIPIPEETKEALDQLNPGDCLYAVRDSSAVLGYVLLTRAKGRYDYFDYSIVYAPDLSILRVYVTVYRSTHGAGICQKKWLRQFVGYKGGNLKLGADVDAVSGGTISSASLVNDIERCHSLMSSVVKEW